MGGLDQGGSSFLLEFVDAEANNRKVIARAALSLLYFDSVTPISR